MSPVRPSPDDYLTLNRQATVARLLSGAAHEVNNALQVINGSVELLQNRPDVPEAVQKGLTRIANQVARAAEAITGVMAFSRSQADAVGRVDLKDVAARAVALRGHAIGRADLTVSLVAVEGPFPVKGHPRHLLQLVLNLIENAEQALAGVRGGHITVQVSRDGGHVVLCVVDNGPGVAAGEHERIFDPFVSTRPRTEASGLGLPVARLIAHAHGGSLTLEPAATGATFTLRIPALA